MHKKDLRFALVIVELAKLEFIYCITVRKIEIAKVRPHSVEWPIDSGPCTS